MTAKHSIDRSDEGPIAAGDTTARPMEPGQKIGGAAAYVAAGTFVFGLLLAVTTLHGYVTATDSASAVSQLLEHESMLALWNLVITILFGIALVPLAIALRDRTAGTRGSGIGRVGLVFGLIWATVILAAGMVIGVGLTTVSVLAATDASAAEALWLTVDTIGNGLGGGNEVVGGVWVILVGVSTWIGRALPRWIATFGIVTGLAGLATMVPRLTDAGSVFGVTMIVWFSLVGVTLWHFQPAHRRLGRPSPAPVAAG